MITGIVRDRADALAAADELPAYVYDLGALRTHATSIRDALTSRQRAPEIFYAAKANAAAPILRTVASYVDGIEVASEGELQHVREVLPQARIVFSGPGKTDRELGLALDLNVERIHVESPYELSRLARIAKAAGREVDVLLRANLPRDRKGAALVMSGPFGMDSELIDSCHEIFAAAPWVRLRGIHAHLASGLSAKAMVRQSAQILNWARSWLAEAGCDAPEIDLGGGMTVDYANPDARFDWAAYGKEISALALPGETLRIEPGRSVTAYAGWYVTQVLDVKKTRGQWYAVLRGGTNHIRTPVSRSHNQPFTVISQDGAGPAMSDAPVTLVGQLCSPKDVFARQAAVEKLAVGDLVVFSMAGAYAWNISHHDFLMHPKPGLHYIDDQVCA